jgi:hypothetical protein
VERQLTQTLCAEVTCVSPGQVTRQGRVDWERVADAQLTGILTGKIIRDAHSKKRFVDIQISATQHVVLVRKKAPLQSMALSTSSLHTLSTEFLGVLRRAHGPEHPAVAAAAVTTEAPVPIAPSMPPPVAPPPAPPAVAPPAPPSVAPSAPATAAAVSTEETQPTPESHQGTGMREPALLEVQLTLAFLNRQYSYAASGTNLFFRNTSVPLEGEPSLLVGVFPLRSQTGTVAAFGLEVAVGTSVGMEVQRQGDVTGTTFPAVSITAGADVITKLRVGKSLLLSPLVGWQMMNFQVSKASDGTVLSGQPAVHWRALRAGLKLDWELSGWCTFFAELSYLYTYSAGTLTSAAYFPNSSPGLSFDSALGFSFRVTPNLELRLGFVFTLYAVDFNGSGPAPVSGVSDQLLGGTFGIRYSY